MKPWKKKEWCIPAKVSADFICHMEDVLSVYARPYDPRRPVICMDETSKQMLQEVRTPLPMKPGQVERYDTEYKRNGVANIFMVVEPLAGKRFTQVTERRTKVDWAHFIKNLADTHYLDAEMIVLVMDNLNTHTKSSLYEAFPAAEAKRIADRLEIHYTPKHGSWLNIAESELSHLSRQCLNRRIPDMETLQAEVKAWNQARNNRQVITEWRFTVEDARCKLKKLYPSF